MLLSVKSLPSLRFPLSSIQYASLLCISVFFSYFVLLYSPLFSSFLFFFLLYVLLTSLLLSHLLLLFSFYDSKHWSRILCNSLRDYHRLVSLRHSRNRYVSECELTWNLVRKITFHISLHSTSVLKWSLSYIIFLYFSSLWLPSCNGASHISFFHISLHSTSVL